VVIAADKNARYEEVLGLLDLLQQSGIREGRPARAAAGEVDPFSNSADEQGTSAQAAARPGRGPALFLAIVVHVVFIAVLIFTIRWQSRAPEPVTAELYAPRTGRRDTAAATACA
jgi:hypothetical protein